MTWRRTINPNNDNGTLTLKVYKWNKNKYIPDTTEDYNILMFLGYYYSVKREEIDALITKASAWGFDVTTLGET